MPSPLTSHYTTIPNSPTLSQILSKPLPIPTEIRKNVGVERALQERQAAATTLECIKANLACLRLALHDVKTTPKVAQEIQELLSDIQSNLVYDEVEMELALDEI